MVTELAVAAKNVVELSGSEILDRNQRAELMAEHYESLRMIARAKMRGERPDHSLGGTALVHEVFLRLERSTGDIKRREYMTAVTALMREILIERARARATQKRGGNWTRTSLDIALDSLTAPGLTSPDELDQVLADLEKEFPRAYEVTVHRFILGFTIEETAELVAISSNTVTRDWNFARAWLRERLDTGS